MAARIANEVAGPSTYVGQTRTALALLVDKWSSAMTKDEKVVAAITTMGPDLVPANNSAPFYKPVQSPSQGMAYLRVHTGRKFKSRQPTDTHNLIG